MVIAIDFMLVDTIFESHLYWYLSTGNRFHCVMVIAIDFLLIDTIFESHLYGYLSTGNEFHCVMVISIDFMLVDTIVNPTCVGTSVLVMDYIV